jgi:Ca2+-binding RTX toxin-like protein
MSRPRLVVTLVVGILILNGLAVPANAAVTCYGRTATILGTAGNDTLRGTPRADVIIARGGNDRILGAGRQGPNLRWSGWRRNPRWWSSRSHLRLFRL